MRLNKKGKKREKERNVWVRSDSSKLFLSHIVPFYFYKFGR